MFNSHANIQPNLFNFQRMGFEILDNELIKLKEKIPWEKLVKIIKPLYANEGRKSKSIRMMIALEIAKTYRGCSDERLVESLKTDVALMIFCGFSSPLDVPEVDSSTMTKFRNRLDEKTLNKISAVIARSAIKELPSRKRTQVASDSTCFKANIKYPTDTNLLIKSKEELEKIVEQVKKNGGKVILKGIKEVERVVVKYRKVRKKSKEKIKKVNKTIIKFIDNTVSQIEEQKITLKNKFKGNLETVKKITAQQKEMLEENKKKVKDRIVSFHETEIRPIYRGKYPQPTEFGKKGNIMLVGQHVIIPNMLRNDNFHDSNLVKKDIEKFEEITGNKPKEYSGDTGYHTPRNHKILKQHNIHDGIQWKGRIPQEAEKDLPKRSKRKRLYRQRAVVEAKIGTLKSVYGCGKIPYKSENTCVRITMGALVHNVRWMMNKK